MSSVIDLTDSPVLKNKTIPPPRSLGQSSKHPSPTDPALQDQLLDAVSSLPEKRLREYIKQSILENHAVAEGLEKVLLSKHKSTGVMVHRVARCGKCREEFDPSREREEGECRYHKGDLEIDDESSTWDDWDENCHGPMDSSENMKEFPEGFVWSCCEGDGRAEGCVEDRHEPASATSEKRKRKRARLV